MKIKTHYSARYRADRSFSCGGADRQWMQISRGSIGKTQGASGFLEAGQSQWEHGEHTIAKHLKNAVILLIDMVKAAIFSV